MSFTVGAGTPVITLNGESTVIIAGNKGTLAVTISGKVTDPSGAAVSVSYTVSDEYGKVNGSGSVIPSSSGDFSFAVDVLARAKKNDRDGRQYTVTITAVNAAGNSATAAVNVVVKRPPKKRSKR